MGKLVNLDMPNQVMTCAAQPMKVSCKHVEGPTSTPSSSGHGCMPFACMTTRLLSVVRYLIDSWRNCHQNWHD